MKKLSFIILLVVLIGTLPSVILYGGFYFVGDYSNQQIPFIMETKKLFSSGLPLWSWNSMYGDNAIGAYSFYTITSPFVWINCLFPYQLIGTSILFTLLLKFLCLGWGAYWYFQKMDVRKDIAQMGALMYAFSSFTIANLFYYHFMEPMIVLPIYLLAIEKFLKEEKWGNTFLILSVFLVAFINFYFMPGTIMFGVIYTIFRITDSEITKNIRKAFLFSLNHLGGIILASFILVPTFLHLHGSPREDFYWGFHKLFIVEGIRSFFMPRLTEGPTELFYGLHSFSSNEVHIPVFGILMAVLFCYYNRRSWLSLLMVTLVIFYLSPLKGLFILFTSPHYTRWAYSLTLIIILCSIKYFNATKGKLHTKTLGIYVGLSLLICATSILLGVRERSRHPDIILENDFAIRLGMCFVLFLLGLLCLFIYYKRQTVRTAVNCIAIFCTIHLLLFNIYNIRHQSDDNIKFIINNLSDRNPDDNFYWRSDFTGIYSNTPILLNKAGVSLFNSVRNNAIRRLMWTTDTVRPPEKDGDSNFTNKIHVESYDALLSVRKFTEYKGGSVTPKVSKESLNLISEDDNKREFAYKYYIPIGFCYDSYVNEKQIDSIMSLKPMPDIPNLLLAYLALEEKALPVANQYMHKVNLTAFQKLPLDSLVQERRKVHCTNFVGNTKGFSASIKMPSDNLVFFSIPHDPGFTAYVDGKETKIYQANLGLSAIEVKSGNHKIEFSYIPPGLVCGGGMSVIGLIYLLFFVFYDRNHMKKQISTI